jgi:hypothetical protein
VSTTCMVFGLILIVATDATAELKERMATTGRFRDQEQRASSARSTLFCAIATGSLKLYGETLTWAKRFVKDPVCSLQCVETFAEF